MSVLLSLSCCSHPSLIDGDHLLMHTVVLYVVVSPSHCSWSKMLYSVIYKNEKMMFYTLSDSNASFTEPLVISVPAATLVTFLSVALVSSVVTLDAPAIRPVTIVDVNKSVFALRHSLRVAASRGPQSSVSSLANLTRCTRHK